MKHKEPLPCPYCKTNPIKFQTKPSFEIGRYGHCYYGYECPNRKIDMHDYKHRNMVVMVTNYGGDGIEEHRYNVAKAVWNKEVKRIMANAKSEDKK